MDFFIGFQKANEFLFYLFIKLFIKESGETELSMQAFSESELTRKWECYFSEGNTDLLIWS